MSSNSRKQRLATRALWLVPILALLSVPGPNVFAQEFMPGEVLVVFNPGTQRAVADLVIANSGARVIQYFEHVDVYHLATAPNRTVAATVALLEQDARVDGASPNYRHYYAGHLTTPKDPGFGRQWGLDNTGRNLVGAAGIMGNAVGVIDADIDAPQAWDHLTDCSGEVVAIIDSGIDLTHPDFVGNLWVNPGETDGDGIDNDGNGVVDDVNGVNVGAAEKFHDADTNFRYTAAEWILLDNDSDGCISVGDLRVNGTGAGGPGTTVAAGNADVGLPLNLFRMRTLSEVHVNTDGNGIYNVPEGIFLDLDASGTVTIGDALLAGNAAPVGTALVAFAERHVEFVPVNGSYDSGEGIYNDADGSGDVSIGDIRRTQVPNPPNPPYAPGSVVAAGDTDIGRILVAFISGTNQYDRHVDPNGNLQWDFGGGPGESIYQDNDNSSTVSGADILVQGPGAAAGTALINFSRSLLTGNVTDTDGHGTWVASVVGARGNNNTNIAGVCWRVQLMTVKTGNNPVGSQLCAGINYVMAQKAAGINVRIINYSSAHYGTSAPENAAIAAAGAAGILFVTASGNGNFFAFAGGWDGTGFNMDAAGAGRMYPCAYPAANIICVGASDNRDNRAVFSNFGTTSVDVNAPGFDILALQLVAVGGGTQYVSGTSFAAPHVAGIAAHFWSLPGFGAHTVAELKTRLLTGLNGPLGVPHPHGVDPRFGLMGTVVSGIINDGRARMTMGDDFGDAPDRPYPTVLNDADMWGARHEDIQEEWLGRSPYGCDFVAAPSDVSPEFDAFDNPAWPADPDGVENLVDSDAHDDGIVLYPPYDFSPQEGPPNVARVDVYIDTENNCEIDHDSGRYAGAHGPNDGVHQPLDDKYIWVNGFFDWNDDGDWNDFAEHVFTLRADPSTWCPAKGGRYFIFFNMPTAPLVFPSPISWARFRLDYGENLGQSLLPPMFPVGPCLGGLVDFWDIPGLPFAKGAYAPNRYESVFVGGPPDLDLTLGLAQFGEVEDYPFEIVTCLKGEVISIPTCTEPPIKVIGTTLGQGNDSSCRPSEDLNISVNIIEPGIYSFSMCGNQNLCGTGTTFDWDAFLYLVHGDSCVCDPADIIASNDDGCGLACVSEILDVFLLPGEYWLVVEGLSVGDAGDFDLHITSECKPSGANLYTDPAEFEAALLATDKRAKASWNFKPNNLAPGTGVALDDPVNINGHAGAGGDPWTDPAGNNLWPPSVDNVTFQSNIDGPQPPLPNPRGIDGLFFANAMFDYDNNILVANIDVDSFDILSGPPAGDNHTAMSIEIVAAGSGPPPGPVLVTVYDKFENPVGKLMVDIFQNPPPLAGVAGGRDVAKGEVARGGSAARKAPMGKGARGEPTTVRPVVMGEALTDRAGTGTGGVAGGPPPPNNDCTNVLPVPLLRDLPFVVNGDNTNSTADCGLLLGVTGYTWEAIIMPPGSSILNIQYCGSANSNNGGPFGNAFIVLVEGCPCASLVFAASFVASCVDGNFEGQWTGLTPGNTYYYPVLLDAALDAIGPYTLTFTAKNPPPPAPIKKAFLGIIMKPPLTIGRVNLYDLGGGAEGISKITVYADSPGIVNTDISGPLGAGFPDGCVDAFDLAVVLGAWCSAAGDPDPPGDVDPPCEDCTSPNAVLADLSGPDGAPDGCVDAFDLGKLLANWCSDAGGNPCGTCGP